MSFILNALRKSESERQRLSGATVAELPLGRRAHGQPWWVYALGVLLALNLVVLALVLLRKPVDERAIATPTATSNAVAQSEPTMRAASPPSTTLRETAAPPQVIYEAVPASEREVEMSAASVPEGSTLVTPNATPNVTPSATVAEPAQAGGDLKLDLHVYSTNARERFVLISMRRYTEGQQLPNGATVEQITPTGVVLYRNGQRYQLSR